MPRLGTLSNLDEVVSDGLLSDFDGFSQQSKSPAITHSEVISLGYMQKGIYAEFECVGVINNVSLALRLPVLKATFYS